MTIRLPVNKRFDLPIGLIVDPDVTPLELRMYALFGVLQFIARPATPMREIAEILNVSLPTANRAVGALDSAGWITRTRQPPGPAFTQVHPWKLTSDELEARAAVRAAADAGAQESADLRRTLAQMT